MVDREELKLVQSLPTVEADDYLQRTAELNFKRLQGSFDAGQKSAALAAIKLGYFFGERPPQWALKFFSDALSRWGMAEVRTLDEAFGVERPKGFRQDAANRRAMFGSAILIEVNRRLETEAYDDEIFSDVGEKWGMGKTAAKDIYLAEMKSIKDRHPDEHKRIISSRKSQKKPAGSAQRKR